MHVTVGKLKCFILNAVCYKLHSYATVSFWKMNEDVLFFIVVDECNSIDATCAVDFGWFWPDYSFTAHGSKCCKAKLLHKYKAMAKQPQQNGCRTKVFHPNIAKCLSVSKWINDTATSGRSLWLPVIAKGNENVKLINLLFKTCSISANIYYLYKDTT